MADEPAEGRRVDGAGRSRSSSDSSESESSDMLAIIMPAHAFDSRALLRCPSTALLSDEELGPMPRFLDAILAYL
jgi:hypothetical protein